MMRRLTAVVALLAVAAAVWPCGATIAAAQSNPIQVDSTDSSASPLLWEE